MAAFPLYADRGGYRDNGLRAEYEVQAVGLGRRAFLHCGDSGGVSAGCVFAVTDGAGDDWRISGSGLPIEISK